MVFFGWVTIAMLIPLILFMLAVTVNLTHEYDRVFHKVKACEVTSGTMVHTKQGWKVCTGIEKKGEDQLMLEFHFFGLYFSPDDKIRVFKDVGDQK